jgi:hypothetical protein
MSVPQSFSFVAHLRHAWLFLSTSLFLSSFFLVSCSGLNFFGSASSSPTAKPTLSQLPLSKLHWCDKPFIVFRDEHAPVTMTSAGGTPTPTITTTVITTATAGSTPSTTAIASATVTPTATTSPTATTGGQPTTITNWSQVAPNLGFSVFLPTSLPRNTCLVSASGTLHDPIFGGSFIIGYLLPDKSPISLSEAPMRTNSRDFQCTSPKGAAPQVPRNSNAGTPTTAFTPSPTQVSILLCTGARDSTNIVFSARGSETSLKQFFDALQPNVEWVPIS